MAYTREQNFCQAYDFHKKLEGGWYFHNKVQKVHIDGLDFCQNLKNLIVGLFLNFLGSPEPMGLFFKNQALSLFLLYLTLKKSKSKKLITQF